MNDLTDEEIDADLAKIENRFATCTTCATSRERRRATSTIEHAVLDACCGTDPDTAKCRACQAAVDTHLAEALREIRTVNNHPHAPAGDQS